MIFAIFLAPLVWVARLLLLLLVAIPGLLLIPWHRRNTHTRESTKFPGRLMPQFRAWYMRLYCNEEDGIDGLRGGDPAQQWWAHKTADWSPAKRIVVWTAFRNPGDGLRWLPIVNPRLDSARVRFIGSDHEPAKGESGWYFAWLAGTAYSCMRVECWGWRFWLGWKLHPEDARGLQAGDVRAIACDFAAQLKRVA